VWRGGGAGASALETRAPVLRQTSYRAAFPPGFVSYTSSVYFCGDSRNKKKKSKESGATLSQVFQQPLGGARFYSYCILSCVSVSVSVSVLSLSLSLSLSLYGNLFQLMDGAEKTQVSCPT
jgi:hypothetical protein